SNARGSGRDGLLSPSRRRGGLLLSLLAPALALALLSPMALAKPPYVEIEQRLTPEQLREVGLSAEQLATLNRMLREADDKT
ncbi:hypothetical protein AB4084_40700, partial [Lysobacter sp. 2RAB21]